MKQWLSRQWRERPAQVITTAFLGLIFIGILVYLREAPKPWEEGIGPRLAEGGKPSEKYYVITWAWWMALFNAVFVLGLLLTQKWWLRAGKSFAELIGLAEIPETHGSLRKLGRIAPWIIWGSVAVSMVVAGLAAWPRMSLNLWGDEEYTFRRHVHGDYRRDDETGKLYFKEISWTKTVYGYRQPNNHIPQTILSRLGHEYWFRNFHQPGTLEVNETILRLPSFIFGLATFPLLAAGLMFLRMPWAVPPACIYLALHPWFLRYMSEMRGYAMAMMCVALLYLAAVRAWQTGKLKWWIVFALAEFFMLWAYLAAVYVPLAVNAGMGIVLLVGWMRKRFDNLGDWLPQIQRWVGANLLAAMLFLQMMAPCLPWLPVYLGRAHDIGEMNEEWLANFGGKLAGGLYYFSQSSTSPIHQSWGGLIEQNWINGAWLATLWLFILLGAISMLSRLRPEKLFLLIGIAGAPALCKAHGFFLETYFYLWYLTFAIPGAVILFGCGIGAAARLLTGKSDPQGGSTFPLVAGWILGFFLVAGFQTKPFRAMLYNPVEPLRAATEYCRGDISSPYPPPEDSGVITGNILMPTPVYDPALYSVHDVVSLDRLISKARAENARLFLTAGNIGWARHTFPELMQRVENSGEFSRPVIFYAVWPRLDRYVFELKTEESRSNNTGQD